MNKHYHPHNVNHIQKIDNDLDKIKNESICLNDRLLLYLKYGCDKLKLPFSSRLDELYKNIRIDDKLKMNNPKTIAVGLLYIESVLSGNDNTQRDIADYFATTPSLVRKSYKEIKHEYDL